jgi:hypothetical protein
MFSECPTHMVKLKEVNENIIWFIMKHIISINCFICCIMDTTISLFITMLPVHLSLIRLGHWEKNVNISGSEIKYAIEVAYIYHFKLNILKN